MLYSLVRRYSPEDVIFYIMDFSSHVLNIFQKTPHCGAAVDERDPDAVDRLFKLLREAIEDRKKRFAGAQVNSFDAYREVEKLPLMLVIVDNFAGLTSLPKGNAYFSTFSDYMRDGVSYGIKILVTGGHLNEFSNKMRQECGTRLALQVKDRFAYSDVLGARTTYVPPAVRGRGMCVVDGRSLEYHTAMYLAGSSEQERVRLLQEELEALATKYEGCTPAPRLPVFSEEETYEEFSRPFAPGRIPLGYAARDFKRVALPLKQWYSLSLYFGNPVGVGPVLHNLLYAAGREGMEVIVVRRRCGSLFEDDSGSRPDSGFPGTISFLESDAPSSILLQNRIVAEIGERKVFRNAYCEAHGLQPTDPYALKEAFRYIQKNTKPLLILFESFYDFCKNADDACPGASPDGVSAGRRLSLLFRCLLLSGRRC